MEMNTKILWYFSLITSFVMAIGGFILIFEGSFTFSRFIITLYTIATSTMLCVLQLSNEKSIPEYLKKYAAFLFTFIGRGGLFIFFGCILINSNVLLIVVGSIIIFIGILFILLHFIGISDEETKAVFGWTPDSSIPVTV